MRKITVELTFEEAHTLATILAERIRQSWKASRTLLNAISKEACTEDNHYTEFCSTFLYRIGFNDLGFESGDFWDRFRDEEEFIPDDGCIVKPSWEVEEDEEPETE